MIKVQVGSKYVTGWDSYSVDTSMLSPADGFSMSFGPVKRDVYDLLVPDEEVQIILDDTRILVGYIDDRVVRWDRNQPTVQITGRDKGGRLIDESMPLLTFQGLGIKQLAEKCVEGWFSTVELQNATNRRLVRGRDAKLAKVSREPAITGDTKSLGGRKIRAEKKVDPGESRWDVLAHFLEEAELLAWSSADGKSFIVGLPNYEQAPQYRFFIPKEGSDRSREGNVLGAEISHSVGERYSRITVIGSGKGNEQNYSDNVINRQGIARDFSGDFKHPKRLIIVHDDVRDVVLATRRAIREMALRDATGHRISLVVSGHSQVYAGSNVLYAFDTVCEFEDEELGIRGRYLITEARFSLGRQGEETHLTLVPEGTVLTQ